MTSIKESTVMGYQGIMITGTSGAGKSSIARKLCEKYDMFQIVQSTTTRKPRRDNHIGEYQYVGEEEFGRLRSERRLLIKGTYRGQYYGTTYDAFQCIVDSNRIPLLVLTPKYVNEYIEKSKSSSDQKENGRGLTFLTVFLDAPDSILNKRLAHRGEKVDKIVERQRKIDRKYAEICLHKIKNLDVEKTVESISSLWKHRNTSEIFLENCAGRRSK